jgi:hypothetical protein
MISNKSGLCCGREARFGQVLVVGFIVLVEEAIWLSSIVWYQKKREAPNLRGFLKIECYHEKRSLSFTFYGGSIGHGGRA